MTPKKAAKKSAPANVDTAAPANVDTVKLATFIRKAMKYLDKKKALIKIKGPFKAPKEEKAANPKVAK